MIDWNQVQPSSAGDLDWSKAEAIPDEVVDRFASTKGLGLAVKRAVGKGFKVRTIDGVPSIVPVRKATK